MMTNEKMLFMDLINKIKSKDFSNVRFYIKNTKNLSVNVYEGEREKSTHSLENAYFVEAGKNGKRCCTFFNSLDMGEDVLNQLEISAMSSDEEYNPIPLFDNSQEYSDEFTFIPENEITDMLISAEKTMRTNNKIASVKNCSCNQYIEEIILMDEKGNTMTDSGHNINIAFGVKSAEDNAVEIAWEEKNTTDLAKIDVNKFAEETARLASDRLYAEPVKSGKYQVVLRNTAAAELISAYLPIFSALEVQNGMSKLKGKLGKSIAASEINLIEKPFYEKGVANRHFDDEGIAVTEKYLIKNGICQSFLYNRKAALNENCESTGNGFKSGVSSNVGISVTNAIFENALGKGFSQEEIFNEMKNGLYVTDLEGVFAGANAVSGNFSLLCKGMIIENGKAAKPFCKVTIAGNFFDLLNDIKLFGNDPMPTSGGNFVESPSLLIGSLAVSGE